MMQKAMCGLTLGLSLLSLLTLGLSLTSLLEIPEHDPSPQNCI